MKNEPRQIHLNIFLDQDGDGDQLNFNDLSEITWSEHRIYENDIKYMRSDGWIPVTERLPEKTGYVIGKSYAVVPFYFRINTGSFHWVDIGGDCTNVTHWMPLPDAP